MGKLDQSPIFLVTVEDKLMRQYTYPFQGLTKPFFSLGVGQQKTLGFGFSQSKCIPASIGIWRLSWEVAQPGLASPKIPSVSVLIRSV